MLYRNTQKLQEINAEKNRYMLLSHHQNAGQNWDMKIANISFKNVSQFRYLGMTVTNQNLIREEIKRPFNSDDACYLLSKNVKIRI
jgi:hypothetical protein